MQHWEILPIKSAAEVKELFTLQASCSQREGRALSSSWQWGTRVAPSLLARGNDDQSAKIPPTPDSFPETMIRIWLRKRHLINQLSVMYQPPTPTSFGMVLLEEQDLWPVWVWENDYSLLKKKKNALSAHSSWLKQHNMDRRGEFSQVLRVSQDEWESSQRSRITGSWWDSLLVTFDIGSRFPMDLRTFCGPA